MLQLFSRRPSLRGHLFLAAFFIAVLFLEAFVFRLLATTEARLADNFMRRHAASYQADPSIVIVDIDDRSLSAMQEIAGLWPWPREVFADLLNGLGQFSPKGVVFDIAFAERDPWRPKSDAQLSEAIKAFPRAYLAATRLEVQADASAIPVRDVSSAFGISRMGPAETRLALMLPRAVDSAGWRLGLTNTLEDGDGVLRRYLMYSESDGWKLPSLPARVASDLGMPFPANSDLLLRWPETGHKRYAFADLYRLLTEQMPSLNSEERKTLDGLFRNKLIVIGSSATSSFDHHLTPLGAGYPGTDILAVALDNLLNQGGMRRLPAIWPFSMGVVMIILLALAFARRVNPLTVGIGLAVASCGALAASDAALSRNMLLPVAAPLVFAWLWFICAAIAGYLRERRMRDQTVSMFQRFLNPEVVRQIVGQGQTVESLSGQTCEITVLFSDIRHFTSLSEARPPQEIVALLNRYFDRQVDVVFRHGGTLDKFIGDCIMAFWGAPIADPLHASHAVAAALEMQENLLAFKQELIQEGWNAADFDVGIGVHTGPAVVGFIGAQRKLEYTAIGDTVNLASRVEGLTKGVARVLVTRATMLACRHDDTFHFELRGSFPVKGRSAEVVLFEPVRKVL